jgi:hypothetical protein
MTNNARKSEEKTAAQLVLDELCELERFYREVTGNEYFDYQGSNDPLLQAVDALRICYHERKLPGQGMTRWKDFYTSWMDEYKNTDRGNPNRRPFTTQEYEKLIDSFDQFKEWVISQYSLKAIKPKKKPSRKLTALIKLNGAGKSIIVCGKEKKPLTKAMYGILSELLKAGPKGLSLRQLVKNSGKGYVAKYLRILSQRDEDWKVAIERAGRSGQGYRVRFE